MDTYEKKYKESLALMVDCIPDEDGYVHVRPQDIFSELKESEDEKIKQKIIKLIKKSNEVGGYALHKWEADEMLVWLEKQGEQKPTDIYPIFRVGDIIRHKEQGFTCKIIAVDTEYRLSECNGTHLPFDSQDAYELVEHKPAEWSEEDESNIKALESILYYDKKLPKDLYLRLNDWLKSLRPQNRWKVVDKGIYVKEPALAQKKDKSEPGQGFVVCYDHTLTPDVYERYIMLSDINCHSGWKPSDKQMEALLSEVNGWVKGCPKQIVLESLYDDLKKLKG